MFKSFLLIGVSAAALAASSAEAVTFAYTGAVQSYTVAAAGIYKLQATGASGGASGAHDRGSGPIVYAGGYGAAVGRTVTVSANTSIGITVGGRGGSSAADDGGGGGGGGTFIVSGNALLLAAGGGGGGGSSGFPWGASPSSASLTTAGKDSYYYGFGGTGGSGGSAGGVGQAAGFGGSGGGAGFHSAGGTAISVTDNASNGGGGGSAPAFMGGGGGAASYSGKHAGNGGFGGGGGGAAGYSGPGGGGGGYSGGGGTSNGLDGGGGGSFGNDASFTAIANHVGNGSASIDAIRLFAAPTVSAKNFGFGVVRGGSAAQHITMTIANAVVAGPISDKLVTILGPMPAAITSSAAPGVLAAGQSGVITYTLSTATAGVFAADLGFASRSATDGDIAGPTLNITGTVTDLAVAVIVGKGDGLLTFKDGHYVLDLGDVAANSGVRSTLLSMLNGVTRSAYSEALFADYSGLSSDGFSLALHNPFNAAQAGDPVQMLGELDKVEGGDQSDLGLLGFDPTGLSLGLHSQIIDFYAFSQFDDLRSIGGFDAPITVEANVTAGVPVAGVPEPETWGLLTAGFGLIGAAMRRRKVVTA